MPISVPDHILKIQPYVAGKPVEELQRELGIKDSIKLASNENPLGPSPRAVRAMRAALGRLHRYPDSNGFELVRALAARQNVKPENIVLGNGSDDIIAMLCRVLLQPGDEVLLPGSSFLMYEIMARAAGARPVVVPLKEHAIDLEAMAEGLTDRTRLIFLNNPHNPTGTVFSRKQLESFLKAVGSDRVVVLDEAYIEFVRRTDCPDSRDYLHGEQVVVGMRTFSKAYGLAGVRIGYGLMAASLAELLHRVRAPFNVNTLAQVGAVAALQDEEFLRRTLALVHRELDRMYAALEKMGLAYVPSQANFVLIDLQRNADAVCRQLMQRGVIVRSMHAYGYAQHIRVNMGRPGENRRFLAALRAVLRR